MTLVATITGANRSLSAVPLPNAVPRRQARPAPQGEVPQPAAWRDSESDAEPADGVVPAIEKVPSP